MEGKGKREQSEWEEGERERKRGYQFTNTMVDCMYYLSGVIRNELQQQSDHHPHIW